MKHAERIVYCCRPGEWIDSSPDKGLYSINCLLDDGTLAEKSYQDVKLSVARDQSTSSLIHVSERTPPHASLCCPHCDSPVTRVAGPVRRFHYRHASGSDCPASAETLLHEGAKTYLQHALSKGIEVELLTKVTFLKHGKVTSLFHNMGIESIAIKASSIYSQPEAVHAVERSYKNLRPDILSYVDGMNERLLFAWEIFVTHEVDEDKSVLLKEYNIPFIELYPIENGKSGYIFQIKSYGGFDLLDGDNLLNSFVNDDYKSELIDIYSKGLEKNIIDTKLLDAKKNWELEHQKLIAQELNYKLRSVISHLELADVIGLHGALSTTIYPITQLDFDRRSDKDWVSIESIDGESFQGGYYIKINKTYFFLSALGMLKGIYEKLTSQKMLMGLVAKSTNRNEDVLVGVKLFISTPKSSSPIERKSLLFSYKDIETSEIEIWEPISKKSITSGKYHMYVNDGIFVDSYDSQLKNIIYHLMQYYDLDAHIGTTEQNKKRIDAIRIKGMIDMELVKGILTRCFDA